MKAICIMGTEIDMEYQLVSMNWLTINFWSMKLHNKQMEQIISKIQLYTLCVTRLLELGIISEL